MKNFLFLLFTVNLFCVTSQINYNESTYFNGRFETNQSLKEYNDISIDTFESSSIRCAPTDIISSNVTEICSGGVIDIDANNNTFLHCGFNYFYGFYWQISFNNGASWNWINPPNVSFSTCGVGFVSYTTQQPSSISLTMNAGPGSILIRRGRLAFNCLNNIVVVWSNILELTELPCSLPVTLTSFTSSCDNGIPVLSWTTESEQNSNYFEIERSRDGFEWKSVSQVQAAGNSNTIKNYQFYDINSGRFEGYYRLKQVDYDGQFEYFNPIYSNCIEPVSKLESEVFPNPTSDEAFIGLRNNQEEDAQLIVLDNSGRVIFQENIKIIDGYTLKTVEMKNYQSGTYQFIIVTSNYKYIHKVIKK